MSFTFIACFAGWRRLVSPSKPRPRSVADDLAAAHDLDRHTAWPTHRIRCVLHTQRDKPGERSR